MKLIKIIFIFALLFVMVDAVEVFSSDNHHFECHGEHGHSEEEHESHDQGCSCYCMSCTSSIAVNSHEMSVLLQVFYFVDSNHNVIISSLSRDIFHPPQVLS